MVQTVGIRQQCQISFVGEKCMRAWIGCYNDVAGDIGGPQGRVSRLLKREIYQTVIHQINRTALA